MHHHLGIILKYRSFTHFFFPLPKLRNAQLQLALAIFTMLPVAKSVSASYALCTGSKDVYMWNEDGQQVSDYGSTPRNDCINLGDHMAGSTGH